MTGGQTPKPADDPEFHLPDKHSPLPELIHLKGPKEPPSGQSFLAVMKSPQYLKLRSTFRGFAFPMTAAGLISYFIYVLASVYAPSIMGSQIGNSGFTWGLVIGLAQFAITWIWTALYVNFANKKLDTVSASIKEQLEQEVSP